MPVFFYVSFVPVLLGLGLAGVIIYWDHRRDRALIEKGLYLPVTRAQSFLAWGLVTTGGGTGIFAGAFWTGMPEVEMVGLAVAFVGIALVVLSATMRTRRASRARSEG